MNILNFRINEKLFYFITLIIIIWVGMRLADAPMERDEGEYAYAGWQILRGGLPYVDFYNMKFPGTYFSYALIFKCFGTSIYAVRLTVLVLNILSSFFIIQIAKNLLGEESSWIAGGTFLLLSMSFGAQGIIANTEHFVVFFAMLGLWLLIEKMPLGAGIHLAIACIMKQHGVFYLGFAFFFILMQHLQIRNLKSTIINVLWFCMGYMIPFAVFFSYLMYNNIIPNFYFFAVEYASAYSTLVKPTFKYISTYKYLFIDNPLFWLVFWAALWHIFKNKLNLKYWNKNVEALLLIVFFIVSFMAICPGWFFRPHYFQLIFPASALIMAYGFKELNWNKVFRGKILGKQHFLAIALMVSVLCQVGYFFYKSPDTIIDELYDGECFTGLRDVGQFLNNKTKSGDKIGMFGSDPQLLFYAQRESASGYMYAYPLVENQPFADRMTHQYIHEIEGKKPEWLVYLTTSKGEDNQKNVVHIDNWFADYSQKYYNYSGVFYEDKQKKGKLIWTETVLDTSFRTIVFIYQRQKVQ